MGLTYCNMCCGCRSLVETIRSPEVVLRTEKPTGGPVRKLQPGQYISVLVVPLPGTTIEDVRRLMGWEGINSYQRRRGRALKRLVDSMADGRPLMTEVRIPHERTGEFVHVARINGCEVQPKPAGLRRPPLQVWSVLW